MHYASILSRPAHLIHRALQGLQETADTNIVTTSQQHLNFTSQRHSNTTPTTQQHQITTTSQPQNNRSISEQQHNNHTTWLYHNNNNTTSHHNIISQHHNDRLKSNNYNNKKTHPHEVNKVRSPSWGHLVGTPSSYKAPLCSLAVVIMDTQFIPRLFLYVCAVYCQKRVPVRKSNQGTTSFSCSPINQNLGISATSHSRTILPKDAKSTIFYCGDEPWMSCI